MKLRSTTPGSISSRAQRVKRVQLFVIAFVMAGAGFFTYVRSQPVAADQFDDQIAALKADMARYQTEANKLSKQSITLKNTLAQLANEKRTLLAQIDLTQARYNKLTLQIKETEKQIADNKDALGTTIADLYVDDEVSPLEMLASSQGIGDFLNKQEYRNSVKDSLSTTIKTVKELKDQLAEQKVAVSKVLSEQKSARDLLIAKEQEQAQLLAQTNNSEAKYQSLIKDTKQQIADARAAQIAFNNISHSGNTVLVESGSMVGYPWNPENCYVDQNTAESFKGSGGGLDGHNYACRQCVSFVAWKIAKETGEYYNGILGNGGDVAYNLLTHPDTKDKYKNLGRSPQPGAVAVMYTSTAPPYGHVAWVADVSSDRTRVLIEQYNYWNYQAPGWGLYSKMWMNASSFDQYVIRK